MLRFHLTSLIADWEFKRGERLRILDIAAATGIHRTTLSKLNRVKGYVTSSETIDRLCAFFGVPVEKVVSFEAEDRPKASTKRARAPLREKQSSTRKKQK